MNHENSHETTPETAVDGLTHHPEGAGTRDEAVSADALELLRLKTALRLGYSGEHAITFAGLLKGATADEIESDAVAVAQLVTTIAATMPDTAFDPSQGHGRGEPPRPTTFADMVNID